MYKTAYLLGGFYGMKGISIEERAINLAHYIIDSKDTVRGAAKKFWNFKVNGTQRCKRKINKY